MANRIETATVTGETIKLSSNDAGAAGSFNAVSLAFTFDSKWDGTTKTVQFLDTYGNNPVNIPLTLDLLISGAYIVPIPAEPLVYAGEINVTVRGVDFEIDGTTAERIIVSASTIMKVKNSLYEVGGATPVEPTPTQAEQLLTAVNSVTGMTVTSTTLPSGSSATVTKTINVDETINLAFGLPAGGKGDTGDTGLTGATGNGISSVVLNPDYTLTINFTDSTSTTTTSIRGATGAKGDVGNTGATGNGISSVTWISGTHAAGTSDTYRITFTDATTFDFAVYNGADGEGAGDMLASVYDPNAKNADAFSMTNMVEGTNNKIFAATERSKLSGITPLATANLSDATLLNRSNHTGTQLKSTISDFPTEMTPTSHAHGNITNDGKIGSTADLMVCTTTGGAVTTKTVADTKTLLGIIDNSYVKLLSTTVGTAANSISLDLSGITTSDYLDIYIMAEVFTVELTSIQCTVNSVTTGYYGASIGTDANVIAISNAANFLGVLSRANASVNGYVTPIRLKIQSPILSTSGYTVVNIEFSGGSETGSKMGRVGNLLTNNLSSVQFATNYGNIRSGSTFTVYGVKK